MDTKSALLTLSEAMAAHQGVTHFAISMRLFGKGDFFKRLSRPGADCRTKTAALALEWFNQNWPADLEWPSSISRPPKTKKEAA
ncbi:hypothetical protein [Tabrizicola fusiformis]|uniref:hypothetical protein n=1 Tax=Tabrizicola sp. SY72 TaxID=2741673 RepID=UPI001573D395|nr:hypothetical protein [Tabrizicola sp. SY72]NTT86893.1 hypothetical protein [Tabrizicola sp. SY72]